MNYLEKILNVRNKTCKSIWFMRQAGRYLPEFRKIRSQNQNFIKLCLNSELSSEITLQPVKRFDLDAAIIFSDILMIPWALDRKVNFIKDIGPQLEPMIPDETQILKNINIFNKLKPLKDSISILRNQLPQSKSLIGFAGAPWTLACYMIEGQSSKDFINTRKALWNSNKWFMDLLDTLCVCVAE